VCWESGGGRIPSNKNYKRDGDEGPRNSPRCKSTLHELARAGNAGNRQRNGRTKYLERKGGKKRGTLLGGETGNRRSRQDERGAESFKAERKTIRHKEIGRGCRPDGPLCRGKSTFGGTSGIGTMQIATELIEAMRHLAVPPHNQEGLKEVSRTRTRNLQQMDLEVRTQRTNWSTGNR